MSTPRKKCFGSSDEDSEDNVECEHCEVVNECLEESERRNNGEAK